METSVELRLWQCVTRENFPLRASSIGLKITKAFGAAVVAAEAGLSSVIVIILDRDDDLVRISLLNGVKSCRIDIEANFPSQLLIILFSS